MNKIILNPLTIIAFTILGVTLLISLRQNINKIDQSQQNMNILEQEIVKLSSEVSQTEQQLEKADDPISKEKILRNELLMQKEGEYIVQIPEVESRKKQKADHKKTTPWEEWTKLIF